MCLRWLHRLYRSSTQSVCWRVRDKVKGSGSTVLHLAAPCDTRSHALGLKDSIPFACTPSCPGNGHVHQVATVVATPTVYPSTSIVFAKATPYIMVNGTNFNVKQTQLYFSPALRDGIDVSIMASWLT